MADRLFVLVHSPLVGPATWSWVADSLRRDGWPVHVPSLVGFEQRGDEGWRQFVEEVVQDCPHRDDLVLVGHSGAGPLLPVIAAALRNRIRIIIFAEASIAPATGEAELAPPWVLRHLRSMAHDGVLPPWSEWWDPAVMEELVPIPERREAIVAELPRLPVEYFASRVPMPEHWESSWATAFVWFSDVYADDAEDAAARGWPVSRLDGGHVHMAVDPEAVAAELVRIATRRGGPRTS